MNQRLCAVVAVLALAACGSDSPPDLCTKAGNVSNAITTKLAACVPSAGGTIPSGSACTTKLQSCSAADRTILNNVLDCLNNALPGSPLTSAQCLTTFPTLMDQLNTCTDSSHIGGLSSACTAALEFDSGSSSTVGAGSCTYAQSGVGGTCLQFVGMDMTSSLCSLFNQQGLTFTYSASGCGATVGGQAKLGTCTFTQSGVTVRMGIYGASASDAATQCAAQGGTWQAGT